MPEQEAHRCRFLAVSSDSIAIPRKDVGTEVDYLIERVCQPIKDRMSILSPIARDKAINGLSWHCSDLAYDHAQESSSSTDWLHNGLAISGRRDGTFPRGNIIADVLRSNPFARRSDFIAWLGRVARD